MDNYKKAHDFFNQNSDDWKFLLYSKHCIEDFSKHHWDLFFSIRNENYRVVEVFKEVQANKKIWVLMPEYKDILIFEPAEVITVRASFEAAQIKEAIAGYLTIMKDSSVCFDITALSQPQILYLLWYLKHHSIKKVSFIYAEPDFYLNKENTCFVNSDISEVRQVNGFEGVHHYGGKDFLLLSIGYDFSMALRVMEYKMTSKLYFYSSFPSLSADMYQESVIAYNKIDGGMAYEASEEGFLSSNDPSLVARSLYKVCKKIVNSFGEEINIYLSPLSTKAQCLGFGLFYLDFVKDFKSISIIYPFVESYSNQNSKGLAKVWLYEGPF